MQKSSFMITFTVCLLQTISQSDITEPTWQCWLLCALYVQLKSFQLDIIESFGDLPGQLVELKVHHSLNAISVRTFPLHCSVLSLHPFLPLSFSLPLSLPSPSTCFLNPVFIVVIIIYLIQRSLMFNHYLCLLWSIIWTCLFLHRKESNGMYLA